jgi:hypothetical protein
MRGARKAAGTSGRNYDAAQPHHPFGQKKIIPLELQPADVCHMDQLKN